MSTPEVKDREVKVTLVKALDLIKDPTSWITGAECRIIGRHGNNKPKYGYCTLGAVIAVTGGYKPPMHMPEVEDWADIEADAMEGPECMNKEQSAVERARCDAALVALGEALEALDYDEVWEADPWFDDESEPEHDPDTARDHIVEFNDGQGAHGDIVSAFQKAIERVAERMRS